MKEGLQEAKQPLYPLWVSPKTAIQKMAREPEKKKLGFFRSLFSPAAGERTNEWAFRP